MNFPHELSSRLLITMDRMMLGKCHNVHFGNYCSFNDAEKRIKNFNDDLHAHNINKILQRKPDASKK